MKIFTKIGVLLVAACSLCFSSVQTDAPTNRHYAQSEEVTKFEAKQPVSRKTYSITINPTNFVKYDMLVKSNEDPNVTFQVYSDFYITDNKIVITNPLLFHTKAKYGYFVSGIEFNSDDLGVTFKCRLCIKGISHRYVFDVKPNVKNNFFDDYDDPNRQAEYIENVDMVFSDPKQNHTRVNSITIYYQSPAEVFIAPIELKNPNFDVGQEINLALRVYQFDCTLDYKCELDPSCSKDFILSKVVKDTTGSFNGPKVIVKGLMNGTYELCLNLIFNKQVIASVKTTVVLDNLFDLSALPIHTIFKKDDMYTGVIKINNFNYEGLKIVFDEGKDLVILPSIILTTMTISFKIKNVGLISFHIEIIIKGKICKSEKVYVNNTKYLEAVSVSDYLKDKNAYKGKKFFIKGICMQNEMFYLNKGFEFRFNLWDRYEHKDMYIRTNNLFDEIEPKGLQEIAIPVWDNGNKGFLDAVLTDYKFIVLNECVIPKMPVYRINELEDYNFDEIGSQLCILTGITTILTEGTPNQFWTQWNNGYSTYYNAGFTDEFLNSMLDSNGKVKLNTIVCKVKWDYGRGDTVIDGGFVATALTPEIGKFFETLDIMNNPANDGSCKTKFYDARDNLLKANDKNYIINATSDSPILQRYNEWARILGENPYSLEKANSSSTVLAVDDSIIIFSLVLVVSVSLAALLIIKRKKEYNSED